MIILLFMMLHLTHLFSIKLPNTAASRGITLTIGQKLYWDMLNAKTTSLIVGTGPAGSGKTMLACTAAVKHFRDKSVKKIILTRPVVSVSEENLGYLPGTINNKMNPWIQPLIDAMTEHYDS